MSDPGRTTRRVISEDPSLSEEANRLLTDELRAVIGRDTVELDLARPDHSHDRHATHTWAIAGVIELRLFLTMIALMLAMVIIISLVATDGSPVFVALAALALAPATVIVALITNRMTDEPEHVSPDTAALLAAEGVGDPDRTFSELVADFRADRRPVLH